MNHNQAGLGRGPISQVSKQPNSGLTDSPGRAFLLVLFCNYRVRGCGFLITFIIHDAQKTRPHGQQWSIRSQSVVLVGWSSLQRKRKQHRWVFSRRLAQDIPSSLH